MFKLVASAAAFLLAFGEELEIEPIWMKEFTKLDVKMYDIDSIEHFNEWAGKFEKKYDNTEDAAYHYLQWVETVHKVAEHNSQGLTYTMGLNQFSDLSPEEFRYHVHGKQGRCFRQNEITLSTAKKMVDSSSSEDEDKVVDAPSSVDWRSKGVVTPVKNQGQCGSCWSFSTTGALECDYAIKTGKLTSLSEQQLVDCAGRSYGCSGCDGGSMDGAMKYVAQEGGLCTEKAYPYKAKDGSCKASSCGTKYDHNKGEQQIHSDSESSLVNAIVKGCVSIAIEANQSAFQSYRSGVLTGNCGTNLDHGVLAVGYGSQSGQDYWLVKNSWGSSWGENGYVKICRNCNKNGNRGECGILMEPLVPTF